LKKQKNKLLTMCFFDETTEALKGDKASNNQKTTKPNDISKPRSAGVRVLKYWSSCVINII